MLMATLIVKVAQMLKRVVVVAVVAVVVAGKQAESRRVNGTTVSPQHQREGYQYLPLGQAVMSG
jgi:hypothetical protein